MVGAGHQSAFQLRAAARQRDFKRVVGWNLHKDMLPRLAETAKDLGLPFESVELDQLGAEADVIITITSSFAPILKRVQVRPGTHLACMGTDTKGKQEVEAALVVDATVFTDEVAQSISIGEAQHAFADGAKPESAITQIGAVINGTHPGRRSADEITLFDGTGVGLQDLAVAAAVVGLAKSAGSAVEVAI
jgi:ornithine cyclodeaminase